MPGVTQPAALRCAGRLARLYVLARITARTVPWWPLLAGMVAGLGVVAVPLACIGGLFPGQFANLLRTAAVCGALGAAFLLDDPAARTMCAVPTTRRLRHAVRAVLAFPAVAVWWSGVAGIGAVLGGHKIVAPDQPAMVALVLRGVTVEAVAILALAAGLAAVAARRATNGAGAASASAAPALMALMLCLAMLPQSVQLFVLPTSPLWSVAHWWWLGLLAVGGSTAVWASRD